MQSCSPLIISSHFFSWVYEIFFKKKSTNSAGTNKVIPKKLLIESLAYFGVMYSLSLRNWGNTTSTTRRSGKSKNYLQQINSMWKSCRWEWTVVKKPLWRDVNTKVYTPSSRVFKKNWLNSVYRRSRENGTTGFLTYVHIMALD